MGSLWLKASAAWAQLFWERAYMIGGGYPWPLFSYTLAFALKPWKSAENLGQGTVRYSTSFCVGFAAALRAASTGLLSISPRFPVRNSSQPIGVIKCLSSFQIKGFPVLGNSESKLAISAVMWSTKNRNPISSWICPLIMYQGALFAIYKHGLQNLQILGVGTSSVPSDRA
jgi:hypothetical protein